MIGSSADTAATTYNLMGLLSNLDTMRDKNLMEFSLKDFAFL